MLPTTARVGAQSRCQVLRLPRKRTHHRAISSQPRYSSTRETLRLDTVSLRGVFNQQIHSSKRSLRSVEDFTESEQRTAYFHGDEIHAIKKGMNTLDRSQVTHMA